MLAHSIYCVLTYNMCLSLRMGDPFQCLSTRLNSMRCTITHQNEWFFFYFIFFCCVLSKMCSIALNCRHWHHTKRWHFYSLSFNETKLMKFIAVTLCACVYILLSHKMCNLCVQHSHKQRDDKKKTKTTIKIVTCIKRSDKIVVGSGIISKSCGLFVTLNACFIRIICTYYSI